nr:uncharacterized protein LOC105471808 isoform X1 [Macaca nemestrina]
MTRIPLSTASWKLTFSSKCLTRYQQHWSDRDKGSAESPPHGEQAERVEFPSGQKPWRNARSMPEGRARCPSLPCLELLGTPPCLPIAHLKVAQICETQSKSRPELFCTLSFGRGRSHGPRHTLSCCSSLASLTSLCLRQYLLSTVVKYFGCVGLPGHRYNRIHFFLALQAPPQGPALKPSQIPESHVSLSLSGQLSHALVLGLRLVVLLGHRADETFRGHVKVVRKERQ